ncbi:ABC-2 type transport system permease protein [Nakamurella panacisegetis]|uniref:ABC-2 type transport system permease protein n=1 Tax=Nakamurella panacisegetis TaxID=1090615 RepID=A0A1H0T698_9ACTN|nr:ABC transporter permease [Nakamurella panacisegetis]SDP49504.1 ABC-2 type transport system permease protein [Nakamurella panacisegetis]
MTAPTTTVRPDSAETSPRRDIAPPPLRRAYRFELVKLLAQWRLRLIVLVCWLGPGLAVAVVSTQTTLPSDTVFGRWMGQTGWAGSLVVLSFACDWVLPLVASLVAGDVFAGEDRQGTWRHLLVAVRSPRRIFLAKALASLTVVLGLMIALAVSSAVGGLAAAGDRPLVGLSGQTIAPGHAAVSVVVAWLVVLAPTLVFSAVGLLGSVMFGRSPMGLLTPVVLAFILALAQLLPLPVLVRAALPSWSFLAWRGLFTDPAQTGPVVAGVVVDLVWALVAAVLAFVVFMRRDFTDPAFDGANVRVITLALAPLVALLAVTVAVLGAVTPASGSGIDRPKLELSLATAYAHLYRLQTGELGRPDVPEAQLRTGASCDKGGDLVEDVGPGNDWRCVVTWHIPGATAVGSAIYQLDVTPDGRYVADGDGPQSVNGFFQVRTPTGDAPNPLWQFDGSVDLFTATQKG